MVRRFTREEIGGRLKAEIQKGRAIFDAFAGTGISAKFAEVGGADMITPHILAKFRMAGHSSMAGYLCIADLDTEDGSFHADNTGVLHFGFDRKELKELLGKTGFGEVNDTNAATIAKPVEGRGEKEFTVFLLIGRK